MISPAIPVRVELPAHLRQLAGVGHELLLELGPPATLANLLDALETSFPQLQGTIRDHATGQRRPFLRFFACQEDISHLPLDTPLPQAVLDGREPLLVIGAIAGG
jgi:molybdopterin converting factor small subunit